MQTVLLVYSLDRSNSEANVTRSDRVGSVSKGRLKVVFFTQPIQAAKTCITLKINLLHWQ